VVPPGHYRDTVSGQIVECPPGSYRPEWRLPSAALLSDCVFCGEGISAQANEQVTLPIPLNNPTNSPSVKLVRATAASCCEYQCCNGCVDDKYCLGHGDSGHLCDMSDMCHRAIAKHLPGILPSKPAGQHPAGC
jgi:hypothetical protein